MQHAQHKQNDESSADRPRVKALLKTLERRGEQNFLYELKMEAIVSYNDGKFSVALKKGPDEIASVDIQGQPHSFPHSV